ncbi:cysteine hydrolase [Salmonella enterica]
MSKRANIIVDLQNEYLPSGKLALVGIAEAVANVTRVIANARAKGELVVNIRHEFPDPNAVFFVPGTDGVEFISAVTPQVDEPVIVKNAPNSFLNTGLKKLLEEKGIDEVVIVGAMSHMCIDATTRAASDLGYKATVIHDACATLDLEFRGQIVPAEQVHAALMSALAFAYAEVVSTDEYLAS